MTYHAHIPSTKDLVDLHQLINEVGRTVAGIELKSLSDVYAYWEQVGMDYRRDGLLIRDEEDRLIASISVENFSPYVNPNVEFYLLPDLFDTTLPTILMEWLDDYFEHALKQVDPALSVRASSMNMVDYEGWLQLFRARGFIPCRYAQEMQILFDQQAPPGPSDFPAGIEIRPFENLEQGHLVWETLREAFRDYSGFVGTDPEESFQRFRQSFEADTFSPEHYLIAWEGDEIVGVITNMPHSAVDSDLAWIAHLGVRWDWRKRGIGLALLQSSLAHWYEQGKKGVALRVDTDHLNGALGLYERAGMQVRQRFVLLEKELQEG
ncbi:hypothetical protein MASR2M15_27340 [Anaerolineales bacterium]